MNKFEKQLRIGNLIYGEFLDIDDVEQVEVCRVMAIDETASLGYGWPIMVEGVCGREWYSDFYGIPLTEEWIIKGGWVPTIGDFSVVYQKDSSNITLSPLLSIPKRYLVKLYGSWIVEVQYVHDLQNLFYALEGVELYENWKTDDSSK